MKWEKWTDTCSRVFVSPSRWGSGANYLKLSKRGDWHLIISDDTNALSLAIFSNSDKWAMEEAELAAEEWIKVTLQHTPTKVEG